MTLLRSQQLAKMNEGKTQNEMIADHLIAGNSITQLEALELYGCLRLSGRIWDLKHEGMPIRTDMIKVGKRKRVARYVLDSSANCTIKN